VGDGGEGEEEQEPGGQQYDGMLIRSVAPLARALASASCRARRAAARAVSEARMRAPSVPASFAVAASSARSGTPISSPRRARASHGGIRVASEAASARRIWMNA
jgi:hypothetical protein